MKSPIFGKEKLLYFPQKSGIVPIFKKSPSSYISYFCHHAPCSTREFVPLAPASHIISSVFIKLHLLHPLLVTLGSSCDHAVILRVILLTHFFKRHSGLRRSDMVLDYCELLVVGISSYFRSFFKKILAI